MPTLSADALLVIAQWRGRPDAALHVVHDVCVPAGRIADHSMMPAVEEVRAAGLTDVVWDGHVLTDAGKTVLAALPPVDGYDAKTALAVLAGMDPPRRPAGFIEECPRYPIEDGPGAGVRAEFSVCVLVGTERSTVVLADPVTGRDLDRQVVQHGTEADAAAAAAYAAVSRRMAIEAAINTVRRSADAPSTPDIEIVRRLQAGGLSWDEIRHALAYDLGEPRGELLS